MTGAVVTHPSPELAGYVECALWSSTDDLGVPIDHRFTADDIHPDTLATMRADVESFFSANAGPIADAALRGESYAQAGHDLWLTRNGHGAGFWDRGLGEVGEQLTDAAHALGEQFLYVGDDGRLHVA